MQYDYRERDEWNQLAHDSCPDCGSDQHFRYWTARSDLPSADVCHGCGREVQDRITG